MGVQVALNHRTEYKYERPITLGPQLVRLRPAPHCRTKILSYALTVQPPEHFINWQNDIYNNHLARLVFQEKTDKMVVEVDLVAELSSINPFDFFLEPEIENFPFQYPAEQAKYLEPYRATQPLGPLLKEFLGAVPREKRATTSFLVDLNSRIKSAIGYTVRMEPGIQSCEETLERAIGSCRDTAWFLVQVLRHLGFASRFASGYLIQLAPADGLERGSKDSADLHAWAEVFLPGAGWIGLDPTSGRSEERRV